MDADKQDEEAVGVNRRSSAAILIFYRFLTVAAPIRAESHGALCFAVPPGSCAVSRATPGDGLPGWPLPAEPRCIRRAVRWPVFRPEFRRASGPLRAANLSLAATPSS